MLTPLPSLPRTILCNTIRIRIAIAILYSCVLTASSPARLLQIIHENMRIQ